MPVVFLNGQFIDDLAGARVGALDAGLQHGVGVFETLTAGVHGDRPWALHLDEHVERLAASAAELGLSRALRVGPLGEAALETVRRAGHARARVRITITGGDQSMLGAAQAATSGGAPAPKPAHEATVLIVAAPATEYPRAMFERGVRVVLADAKANPFNPHESHKTLNYWWRLRALQHAAGAQAGEAMVFSVTNHLCGGCVSNVLLIKDKQAFTPVARGEEQDDPRSRLTTGAALPSPVRPGVTRGWAIDELIGEGTVVHRQLLTIDDVLKADEVMLTNSSWGVLPVTAVEAHTVGDGAPGPVTKMLMERWGNALDSAGAQ